MLRYIVLLLIIAGVGALAFWSSKLQPCGAVCAAGTQSVDATEFSRRTTDDRVVILDVRTPDEYASGHIAGAVNVDFYDQATFTSYLDRLDRNTAYLVYCRSGNRSGQALERMQELGFTNVTDLSGGIHSWQAAGLPLE